MNGPSSSLTIRPSARRRSCLSVVGADEVTDTTSVELFGRYFEHALH
jgi:hypothetical protein